MQPTARIRRLRQVIGIAVIVLVAIVAFPATAGAGSVRRNGS